MKYKAIFLDVDGTIIPYGDFFQPILPSPRVTEAIRKASEKVYVCLATGRPVSMLEHIFDHLNLKGYAVVNDGAQVIDIQTRKVFYQKRLYIKDVLAIGHILQEIGLPFFVHDGTKDILFDKNYKPKSPWNMFTNHTHEESIINAALEKITHIPTIKVSKTHSGENDTYGLLIAHAEATKLHGIYEVINMLNIRSEEVIGVGDSGNDFPLLMASGFKVAMGNAIPGLKDIADHIAPSVTDDGVADTIEKFILSD